MSSRDTQGGDGVGGLLLSPFSVLSAGRRFAKPVSFLSLCLQTQSARCPVRYKTYKQCMTSWSCILISNFKHVRSFVRSAATTKYTGTTQTRELRRDDVRHHLHMFEDDPQHLWDYIGHHAACPDHNLLASLPSYPKSTDCGNKTISYT